MTVAYTESQTKVLVEMYLNGSTIDELAVHFNKTRRSVISKLSKEGVYEKKGYLTKLGEKPESKASMVTDIEEVFGERFIQLDKIPKPTLVKLRNCICNAFDEYHTHLQEREEMLENIDILKNMLRSKGKVVEENDYASSMQMSLPLIYTQSEEYV